jgi:pseudouridine-5'-phosphate glycosidase
VSAVVLSAEVRDAIESRRPVVALETTVVTHGLPHPQGVDTALAMEAQVRAAGAIPATSGVLDGALVVGLNEAQLRRLAAIPNVAKLNLANLAAHANGSLTVAATLFAAHQAGIAVFATGGIGGVHRGAADTGDISGDLYALNRFPVAVVCAGAKAILDLPRTREMLETLGVPVYGFGTSELPAFYRRASGIAVDARFDDIESLARAVGAHFKLGIGTGIVIGNPIPESDELRADVYDHALAAALRAPQAAGRDATPALLEAIRKASGGRSIDANRALLRSNAKVAGQLARALG